MSSTEYRISVAFSEPVRFDADLTVITPGGEGEGDTVVATYIGRFDSIPAAIAAMGIEYSDPRLITCPGRIDGEADWQPRGNAFNPTVEACQETLPLEPSDVRLAPVSTSEMIRVLRGDFSGFRIVRTVSSSGAITTRVKSGLAGIYCQDDTAVATFSGDSKLSLTQSVSQSFQGASFARNCISAKPLSASVHGWPLGWSNIEEGEPTVDSVTTITLETNTTFAECLSGPSAPLPENVSSTFTTGAMLIDTGFAAVSYGFFKTASENRTSLLFKATLRADAFGAQAARLVLFAPVESGVSDDVLYDIPATPADTAEMIYTPVDQAGPIIFGVQTRIKGFRAKAVRTLNETAESECCGENINSLLGEIVFSPTITLEEL